MPQTLSLISAARRLRNGGTRRPPTPDAPRVVTPLDAGRAQTLANFEREVHAVREAIFNLSDVAHGFVSQDSTQLHVSLQIVSNELGQIERMLDRAHAADPDTAAAS